MAANSNSQPTTIKALHDSGCAKTIISKRIFDQLAGAPRAKVIPLPTVYISSCTGEKTNVHGLVTLTLKFLGDNDKVISFQHDALIHDGIEHDFLLGRDFTGSSAKILETTNHLYLTNAPIMDTDDAYDVWERQKRNYVDVPIINNFINSHALKSNHEHIIPPQTLVGIACSALRPTDIHNQLIRNKKQPIAFEVTKCTYPDIRSPDALYNLTDPTNIGIAIFNDTLDDLIIPANTHIAEIELWTEEFTVNNLQVSIDNSTDITVNSVKDVISEDPHLTEDEKYQAFKEYLDTGEYTMPMSSYIDKSPSITEMKYTEIKPWTDEEFDQQFDIGHLHHHQRRQTLEILRRHKQVFSRHEFDIGCSKSIEMTIDIDKTKPRIQKYYPLPYPAREPTRKALDQLLEFNVLRVCPEPSLFVSNLLVTRKKNDDIRVLLDGRLLNDATIRNPTSLVAPLEIFAILVHKTHVTILDVSNAFFQIPISKECQPLTAFFSEAHGMRYCYQRAPQGLKNSPLFLKLLMDKMFGHMAKYVIHYADDVMIATEGTFAFHLKILHKVLQAFKEENIKIKPQKLEIAKPEVQFLGVIWKKGTLNIPQARVKAFQNTAVPTTPKKVKSFVCAMSYYRRFIPNFAKMAKPLMELATDHHKRFKWERVHQKAFVAMISAITEHTKLQLPDPLAPFYVQTDASDVAGAGRVFQKADNGSEKLIACVSRTFTKAERKYGVFRKEVLSLLYCLKSMDFFLRFAKNLIILIDAKSIIYLRLCKESAGILLRFSLELSKYDAEIHHVPGVENEVSDFFSRHHKDIDNILENNKKLSVLSEKQTERILRRLTIPNGKVFTQEEVASLLELDSLPGPPSKKKKTESKAKLGKRLIKNTPKTLGEKSVKLPATSFRRPGVVLPPRPQEQHHRRLQHRTQRNNYLGNVATYLATSPATVNYNEFAALTRFLTPGNITLESLQQLQKADQFSGPIYKMNPLPTNFQKIDDVLYKIWKSKHRLVLPSSLLDSVIYSKHFSLLGLHFSKTRIRRDLLDQYYCDISALNIKLQKLTSTCIQCQFNASNPTPHIFKQMNIAYAPRVAWAVDLIPSLTESKSGNSSIFLAVDMFTGFIQLRAMKTRQTTEIIEAIKTTIIAPFGIPKFFRCDNETSMANSAEFLAFMEPLKINFLPCSTASPWSNGAAERAVQTIKKAIRRFIQQEKSALTWDEYLHFFSQAHNKSCTVYNYTPEQLQFGFLNPALTDLIEMWPKFDNQETYMNAILPEAQEARRLARERAVKKSRQVHTYRNQSRIEKTFKPGQIVLHRQLQVSTGTGGALKPKFTGPYVIESIDKDESSATIEHLQTRQQIQAHFTNIQLFEYDPATSRLPFNFDEQLNDIFPDKSSDDKYRQSSLKKRKILNLKSKEKLKRYEAILQKRILQKQKEQQLQSQRPRASSTPPRLTRSQAQSHIQFQTQPQAQNTDTYRDSTPSTSTNPQGDSTVQQPTTDINDFMDDNDFNFNFGFDPNQISSQNSEEQRQDSQEAIIRSESGSDNEVFHGFESDDNQDVSQQLTLSPLLSEKQKLLQEAARQRNELEAAGEAFYGFQDDEIEEILDNQPLQQLRKRQKGKQTHNLPIKKSKIAITPDGIKPVQKSLSQLQASTSAENDHLQPEIQDEFYDENKDVNCPSSPSDVNSPPLKPAPNKTKSSSSSDKRTITTRSKSKLSASVSNIFELVNLTRKHRTSVEKLLDRDKEMKSLLTVR